MSVTALHKSRKRKGFTYEPIEPPPGITSAEALELTRAHFYRTVCDFFWKHRRRSYLAAPVDAPLGFMAPPPYVVVAQYDICRSRPDRFHVHVATGDRDEGDYLARHGDDDEVARFCYGRKRRFLLSVIVEASRYSGPRVFHDFMTEARRP